MTTGRATRHAPRAKFLPRPCCMSSERGAPSRIVVHERSARDIAGGRRILLSIEDGEHVPGLLLLPTARQRVPAALLLHGYSSRKERMSEVIGMALLRRSEEHTSELQSRQYLVCRLLLEKK